MLTLPENPTPEQLKAVVLAIVRQTFENDADNLKNLEPLDNDGWKAQYDSNGRTFNIEYTPKDGFTKWPVGGGLEDG